MVVRRICCIGAGYIGGISSTVIAMKCPEILVTVVDDNAETIMQWNSEKIPILEPGLDEAVKECRNKNLFFSVDIITAIKNSDLIFLCVNSTVKSCGSGKGEIVDLKYLDSAARIIADVAVGEKIVVEKSTDSVKATEIISKILKANHHSNYHVLSNPEFLTEGKALHDALFPDRVLIGGDDTTAINKLSAVYEHWIPREKIVTTNTYLAELAKIATNAFIAQRISNINSLSPICESLGMDVSELSEAIGLDSRIGSKYLTASLGFGGRGFKKDIMNLIYICKSLGYPNIADYWQQVLDMNNYQMMRFSNKIVQSLFHTLADKKISILGFAFKKDIHDTKNSPAIYVCQFLLNEGAKLHIYDPQVPKDQILKDLNVSDEKGHQRSVSVFDDPYHCISNTHAIVVCTGWDEFKTLDYERIFADMMKPAYVFDGRKILPHKELVKIGYNVECIGTVVSKPVTTKNWKPY